MESHSLNGIAIKPAAGSGFWWAGAPGNYPVSRSRLLKRHSNARQHIETLLPIGFASAERGIAGALSSLATITSSLIANRQYWTRRARQWSRLVTPAPLHRTLYEAALHEGAELLFDAWRDSGAQRGWMVAEIEPSELHSALGMFRRARELGNLMPNIMPGVPVSDIGCEVIEELVATGHAVNASLCFSVAQVQAAQAAIRRGRWRALREGIGLARTRHLISVVPATMFEHPAFTAQAARAGIELSEQDRAWVEVAVYQAQVKARCGPSDSTSLVMMAGNSRCRWRAPGHCASNANPLANGLYCAGEAELEALLNRRDDEAHGAVHFDEPVPADVLHRLLAIQGVRQLCGIESLDTACFSRHPLYLQGISKSLRAYTRLLGFARQLGLPLHADIPQATAAGRF